MNQEERITALEKRIADLENPRFLNQNLANLLSQAGFMRRVRVLRVISAAGREFQEMIFSAGGQEYSTNVAPGSIYIPFTVDGNYIVWGGYLDDGRQVDLFTTGELPAGLSSTIPYYVTASAAGRFRVSQGGTPVTITGNGTGQHFFRVV